MASFILLFKNIDSSLVLNIIYILISFSILSLGFIIFHRNTIKDKSELIGWLTIQRDKYFGFLLLILFFLLNMVLFLKILSFTAYLQLSLEHLNSVLMNLENENHQIQQIMQSNDKSQVTIILLKIAIFALASATIYLGFLFYSKGKYNGGNVGGSTIQNFSSTDLSSVEVIEQIGSIPEISIDDRFQKVI